MNAYKRFAVGLAGFIVCMAPTLGQTETPANTLVMAQQLEDLNTDPGECYAVLCQEVVSNIYSRLIRYNPDDPKEIIGDVAESWTVSPDGSSIEFKIRKGLKFESGETLTADDVAFSLQRVIRLNKGPAFLLAQFGWNQDNVGEAVKVVDENTLLLTFVDAVAPTLALNVLATYPTSVVEKKVALANEVDGDLGNQYLKKKSATAGPYKLVTWRPAELLVLEANEQSADAADIMPRVMVRNVLETATQRLLLEKGDVDIARDLSSDQLASVEGNPDIRIDRFRGSDIWYIGMNVTDEHLASPKVREALRYLVDYEGMTKSFLAGRFIVQQSFLPIGMFGALELSDYKLDVEKAKGLLGEAGFPDGFELELDVPNTSPYVDIAQSMQQTMAQAGVKLSLVTGDLSSVITKFRARKHQLVVMNWTPDHLDPHSNANSFAKNLDNSDEAAERTLAWRNRWDIPELSKQTLAAAQEIDTEKRRAEYATLQDEVRRTGPFIFMFQSTPAVAVRANVTGFKIGSVTDLNLYTPIRKQ